MGEVVNVIVAFAVIVLIFRWATSGSDGNPSAADTLGFRPKNVSQDMLDTVSTMFPDIPIDNIRYDLLRTGSVERTTNKILERGYLEVPPPAYFNVYPRTPASSTTAAATAGNRNTATTSALKPKETLITRYQLENRVSDNTSIPDEEVGGRAAWEDTAEKREASLRERKAKMILAARQRMQAQAQKAKEASFFASA